MTANDKSTLMRQLQDIRNNKISERDLYGYIHEFGLSHFLEARLDVERYRSTIAYYCFRSAH
jgi:hypothetical protein